MCRSVHGAHLRVTNTSRTGYWSRREPPRDKPDEKRQPHMEEKGGSRLQMGGWLLQLWSVCRTLPEIHACLPMDSASAARGPEVFDAQAVGYVAGLIQGECTLHD